MNGVFCVLTDTLFKFGGVDHLVDGLTGCLRQVRLLKGADAQGVLEHIAKPLPTADAGIGGL